MRILNIGLDKTLVGGAGVGDAVARHREYGRHVESLDIIVYTSKQDNLKPYQISENVQGYPTNSRSKLAFLFDAVKIASNLYHNHPYDIIVAQEPYGAGLVGWWLKRKFPSVKLQVNLHGDFWENPRWIAERWYNRFLPPIIRFVLWRADAIRVMSQGQRQKLLAAGIPERKIHLISTPVDINRFERFLSSASPDRLKLLKSLDQMRQGKRMILWLGRNDPVKDLETLLRAVCAVHALRPDVGLWLVGVDREDAIRVAQLRHLPYSKEQLMSFVTARRGLDHSDTPAYYYLSEMAVLSSTSESFGKVLVEANACGKPVVATATAGAREILEDGYNGFLVPIKDWQALADKILYVLDHPEKAKNMGENGRRLVKEKYGSNTDKIIQLWRDMKANVA